MVKMQITIPKEAMESLRISANAMGITPNIFARIIIIEALTISKPKKNREGKNEKSRF